ncbi:MAG: hypothetical protein Q9183_000791 [Haloplaca sp. 2 TL-2023]
MKSSGNAPAQRTTAQLRFLSVLERWISEYPGDFAPATTRSKMASFLSDIAGYRPFSMALKEIHLHLDNVFENDDTAWACSDVTRSHEAVETCSSESVSTKSVSSTVLASPPKEETNNDTNAGEKASSMIKRISTTPSTASSAGKSSSHSVGSSQTTTSFAESAPRQALSLMPYPQTSLCKVHWHLFMRLSDDEIAQELTRIDWIMFSSITPRDLVRHISLSDGGKEKCRSLEHVSRMISHFNHVAFWIANVILLRDKPKHRAKALEKCMAIAWRLRQLNNYNSLGAVVAGINGTAVHRLHQTRSLIAHPVQKQFMRLEILMGTQKSHFAYRLAWANTSAERIPFLPLLRRDLACAEEGNATFVGEQRDRINWKKFEIIGDVLVNIQRSQALPYPCKARNEEAQRLILGCKFSKDDDVSPIAHVPFPNRNSVGRQRHFFRQRANL